MDGNLDEVIAQKMKEMPAWGCALFVTFLFLVSLGFMVWLAYFVESHPH